MASVELRPGDTLKIVWTALEDTPLGSREVESSFALSYEEIFQRLRQRSKSTSRRSGTKGAHFSRMVALSTHALRKGKWSTGADIDRRKVFAQLFHRFKELEPSEYPNITVNARIFIKELREAGDFLDPEQRRQLETMYLAFC